MDKRKWSLIIPAILLLSQPLHADTLDTIKFLKVSEQEGKAVIRGSDGKLRMIGVGDTVGGDSKVVEIAKDRVVLERKTETGIEKIIVRLENGEQKIERVTKAGDKQPLYGRGTNGGRWFLRCLNY
ncbi:MAG TPA: type II secretion system protein N [Candidatus Brocadiaceae bacterium]|nr:type II secretion system protein N [Candidatus Brocadiaceae bacterium]